jgi:hypothetical protein
MLRFANSRPQFSLLRVECGISASSARLRSEAFHNMSCVLKGRPLTAISPTYPRRLEPGPDRCARTTPPGKIANAALEETAGMTGTIDPKLREDRILLDPDRRQVDDASVGLPVRPSVPATVKRKPSRHRRHLAEKLDDLLAPSRTQRPY